MRNKKAPNPPIYLNVILLNLAFSLIVLSLGTTKKSLALVSLFVFFFLQV